MGLFWSHKPGQGLQKFVHALQIVEDDRHVVGERVVILLQTLIEVLQGGAHDTQWVAQLMGQARGELPHAGELFRLNQLLLEPDTLAQVFQKHDYRWAFGLVRIDTDYARFDGANPFEIALGRQEMELHFPRPTALLHLAQLSEQSIIRNWTCLWPCHQCS